MRFLKDGPYEDGGGIPPELRDKRLTDEETAAVIAYIHVWMVNCFKDDLTQLLAVAPCLQILRELQSERRLPRETRLYVGDAVWTAAKQGNGYVKGADLHFLTRHRADDRTPAVSVDGVVEVKSYFRTPKSLRRELDYHLARARRGLRVGASVYGANQVIVGNGKNHDLARITVAPAHWELPRTFRFDGKGGRKILHVDPMVAPAAGDRVERISAHEWRVMLRWSKEALDSASYGMTYWFMEKVGETLYAEGVPKEWGEMTPAEAGQNAAKMMLYYAILRCRTRHDEQRAIALYNSYSYGCALGMNFRNPDGHREMLWPEDLDEIIAHGKTKSGCRIF